MKTKKCLSVRQPWAWLIVHGFKPVENRTWSTAHRGELLIHASKTIDKQAIQFLTERKVELPEQFDTGAIIGQVDVTDCTLTLSSNWHVDGQIGWYLERAIAFDTPTPYSGRLGLFDVPEGILQHD